MGENANILVVDDEKTTRDFLKQALEAVGHVVFTAEDGAECVEKVKNEKFDLVLLDLKMPVMDGIEALKEIKKINSIAEVIIMSGFGTMETAVTAMKAGAYDFINKPFEIPEIRNVISKALEKRELKLELSLYKASKTLFSSMNLINLLDRIIDLILRIITADDASIMLFDADSRLFIANSYSLNDDKKRELHLDIGRRIIKRVSITKRAVTVSNNLSNLPEFNDLPDKDIIKSAIICPLLTKRELLGLIILTRTTSINNFIMKDLHYISIVANQMAQALENAGLYKKLEIKIDELKKTQENLEYGSTHDPLTMLPNRLLLHDRLLQAISQAKRYNYFIAVMLIDVDNFKEINDTLGHAAGDMLLKEVSMRLKSCIREYHTVARMGGDEFVCVIGDLTNDNEARATAVRILKSFEDPFKILNHELNATASIGVTIYPTDGENIELLLQKADMSLSSSKSQGGNRYSFFAPSMGKAVEERMIIKEGLIKAIHNNEFEVYYQPLNDTDSGKIVGAEALIRWNHPTNGIIQPLNFIHVAESTGLILTIGQWVLRKACMQAKLWKDKGHPLPIAVNISTCQLRDKEFINIVLKILEETGFPADSLILEVTESSAMQNIELSIQILEKLHSYGIQFFIDDFGSEYSSFNWLKRLPVQGLKIDKFFIHNIIDDVFNATIVKTIITMAHSLNIKVIVEGVETAKQLEFLKSTKWEFEDAPQCDHVQGFLFSQPIKADEFTALLLKQKI